MVLVANIRRVFGHTLVLCVAVRIILASCNISRINRVVNPSIPFRSLTPGVCNLESLRLLKNSSNLAFVPYSPISWKHSYQKNKYVSYKDVEDSVKERDYSSTRYESLEPLYVKRPSAESQVAQVVKSDHNASLFSGDFLGSRLRSVRDSFNKLSKKDLVWVANKAGLFGLWYFGNVFYNVENRKLLNLFPVPLTVSALQNLLSVPLMTFRWFLNLEKAPEFYLPPYQSEKVDLRRDGLFTSVKKSVMNALNKTKAYVKAYKTVLVQGSYASAGNMLSYVARNTPYPSGAGFLRALEPLMVSLLTYLVEDSTMPNLAYLSLLPFAVGVAYATQSNFEFSSLSFSELWKGTKSLPFLSLLVSVGLNCFRRDDLRSYFKQNLDKVGKNVTPKNLNTLANVVGSLVMLPLALVEKDHWGYAYSSLMKKVNGGHYEFFKHLLLSSLAYGLVNHVTQVGFSDMSPVTQAVAQSVKNVMTMLTNSFYLDRKLSKKELYGTALAIAGALLYSLTKNN